MMIGPAERANYPACKPLFPRVFGGGPDVSKKPNEIKAQSEHNRMLSDAENAGGDVQRLPASAMGWLHVTKSDGSAVLSLATHHADNNNEDPCKKRPGYLWDVIVLIPPRHHSSSNP